MIEKIDWKEILTLINLLLLGTKGFLPVLVLICVVWSYHWSILYSKKKILNISVFKWARHGKDDKYAYISDILTKDQMGDLINQMKEAQHISIQTTMQSGKYIYDLPIENKLIIAFKNIKRWGVKKGDIGGFLYSPKHLSQEDDSWIWGGSSGALLRYVDKDVGVQLKKDSCFSHEALNNTACPIAKNILKEVQDGECHGVDMQKIDVFTHKKLRLWNRNKFWLKYKRQVSAYDAFQHYCPFFSNWASYFLRPLNEVRVRITYLATVALFILTIQASIEYMGLFLLFLSQYLGIIFVKLGYAAYVFYTWIVT